MKDVEELNYIKDCYKKLDELVDELDKLTVKALDLKDEYLKSEMRKLYVWSSWNHGEYINCAPRYVFLQTYEQIDRARDEAMFMLYNWQNYIDGREIPC